MAKYGIDFYEDALFYVRKDGFAIFAFLGSNDPVHYRRTLWIRHPLHKGTNDGGGWHRTEFYVKRWP